jgi:predicted nucleic acid-binding Zn ribbon protein
VKPGAKRPSRRYAPRSLAQRTAKDAVADALAFHGITDEVRVERVITEWTELVGPKIASRTRPYGVFERVLVVEVASSAWLHELNLLKAQILAGLLDRIGKPAPFDDLKLKIAGRTRARQPAPRPRMRPTLPSRPPSVAATGARREQIVHEVERVDDAELRELIARVRIQHDR